MNKSVQVKLRKRFKKLKPVKEATTFEEPGLLKAFTPRATAKVEPTKPKS